MAERGEKRCNNREVSEDNGWITMFGIVKRKRNIASFMVGS